MAQKEYEPESSENSAKNRVRETSGGLELRKFDSLPAAAGLTNAEAFRLSIQHALTLLPVILDRRRESRMDEPSFERFRLK
jgi:hypothetical protein